MNIMVFDTETVSVNKPFCYNIGYVIYNTDTDEMLAQKDFVVEQIWHNMPLFSTAYYADKRPIYVNRMRAKKTKMNKFGYICKEMIRDLISTLTQQSPFAPIERNSAITSGLLKIYQHLINQKLD